MICFKTRYIFPKLLKKKKDIFILFPPLSTLFPLCCSGKLEKIKKERIEGKGGEGREIKIFQTRTLQISFLLFKKKWNDQFYSCDYPLSFSFTSCSGVCIFTFRRISEPFEVCQTQDCNSKLCKNLYGLFLSQSVTHTAEFLALQGSHRIQDLCGIRIVSAHMQYLS